MKVLLAYAEPFYMAGTIDILETEGYEVISARSKEEAENVLAGDPGGFDLAIVGTGCCLSGGELLVKQMKSEWPDLRIIAISTWESDLDFCKKIKVSSLLMPFKFSRLLSLIKSKER